ncbi:MAG: prenyltransferase [Myxococcales bacterium]|nr:prenyltransferase [Myxococcales bacterium]MCB9583311.1 prenyltransferase [Polyangiaceae bacterium]
MTAETLRTHVPPFDRDLWRGIWRIADPKITLASVASMILGAALAGYDGAISWGWLAITVLGIFCVEAAKNASGEIVDWDSGTDQALRDDERTPFSGGKRVLVDRLMSRGQLAVVAGVFYVLATVAGLLIVGYREPLVFWLGVAGMALAFFYHAPPLKLSYRGLGEVAVGLAYGPIIAAGTYLVQRHTVSADVLLASIPLGLAITAFLWINELPDARADASAGKRTLVVVLGHARAAKAFAALLAITWLGVVVLPFLGLPLGIWGALIGAPLALRAARRVLRFPDVAERLVPAQQATLLSFVLLAVGAALGVLLVG